MAEAGTRRPADRELTRRLTRISLTAALSLVLTLLAFPVLPAGGSVSAMMVPLVVLARTGGGAEAAVAGILTGILKVLFSGRIVGLLQLLLDYPLAFAAAGLAAWGGILSGISLACLVRLLLHSLSGRLYFSPDFRLSLAWNAGHMVPEWLLTLAVILPLERRGYLARFRTRVRGSE